jgi:hypothetical protein
VCRFLSTSNVGRAHDDDAILSLLQSIWFVALSRAFRHFKACNILKGLHQN